MKKILYLLVLFYNPVFSQESKIDTLKYCLSADHVGVGGFDPVGYFQGKAQQGLPNISTRLDGVKYHFVSEEHKNAFIANPLFYLPQYGGWCSMTLAMGRATAPKYDNFLVSEGKLYLFERTLSVNGRELWLKDPLRNEKIAAKNYAGLIKSGRIK
ncbi:MAG TPA: YHS domain-containing (seleno)protein [Cyclobacteriaceae bacterium]|nr:YHS domain-containing (seleno)protein [Cyclobacteriaceae bacterium]